MWSYIDAYEASVRFTRTNPIQIAGTSFSAPIVTGTAALLLQKYPWMSNDNLRTTLLTTAQDIGAVGVDSKFGWGLLDAGKAMNGRVLSVRRLYRRYERYIRYCLLLP